MCVPAPFRACFSVIIFCIAVGSLQAQVPATIDLMSTPLGKRLQDDLHVYGPAVGNSGSTTLATLHLDTNSGRIEGNIKIKISHGFGTISWTDYFSIPPVDNSQDIGVSAEAEIAFTYNVETGDISGSFEVPLGERSISFLGKRYSWDFGSVKLNSDIITRVLQGDLGAALEGIPGLGTLTKQFDNNVIQEKKSISDKYGAANVWFCSSSFIDDVCPSKGFGYIFSAIATGGATVEATLSHLESLAQKELTGRIGLLPWVQNKGIDYAQSVAENLIKGHGINMPKFVLIVKWKTVQYRSRTLLVRRPITPWVPENHGMFYVVMLFRNPDGGVSDPDEAHNNGGQGGNGGNIGDAVAYSGRLELSVRQSSTQIIVSNVRPGGRSTRCTDDNGQIWQLTTGDVITAINGKSINDLSTFSSAVDSANDQLQMAVSGQDGHNYSFVITLANFVQNPNRSRFGAYVTTSNELAGVVVTGTMENSAARRCLNAAGKQFMLTPGDVITTVNGAPIKNVQDFVIAVKSSAPTMALQIVGSDGTQYDFTVSLD